MDGTAFWLAALLASALVGMGKGGLPVVGMLGVPVLALVISPVTAAGVLLPVYVLSDAFGLYAYRHGFDRRVLAILVPGMVAGVAVGWATARIVPEAAVTGLVGAIGLVFALSLLVRRRLSSTPRRAKVAPGLFWGVLTGFTSFVSHSGAPPYQVYVLPLGLGKMAFAATGTVAFAILNAVKLLPYWHLGQLSPANLQVAVVLMPVAALSVFVGLRLVRWLPEAVFFRVVTWALLAVSLKLLWDAIGA
ncbi:MAG: sulfite exporter TauE/SafE family protein [Rhodobacteraceae bacterium]|nr:sulfite exporter TauE/SafE family protein [Paracoccaceae bacterium]